MKVSEWIKVSAEYTDLTGSDVILEGNRAKMILCGEYSVVNIACDVTGFDVNKFINIEFSSENTKAKVFKVARWYRGENLLLCEFVDSDVLRPMKGADRISITVTAYGEEETFDFYISKLEEGDKIKERKAVLAAVAIDYGFECEHEKRSCEDNLNDSIAGIDALCRQCKPDIVVLTETFYSRNIRVKNPAEIYLSLDGPQIQRIKDKAKEHGIYIAASIRERDSKGIMYNSCFVADREGNIVANYHKTHLTRGEIVNGLKPGDEAVVFEADFGKVGIAICWDIFYSEYVRTLAKKGAEIVINPTAGFAEDMHTMRAKDNGVYIVAAGVYRNTCAVINPAGIILSDGIVTGAAVAEVDLNERFPVPPAYSERKSVYANEMRGDLYEFFN